MPSTTDDSLQARLHNLERTVARMQRTRRRAVVGGLLGLGLVLGLACAAPGPSSALLLSDPDGGATVELSPAGLRFSDADGTARARLTIADDVRLALSDRQGQERWTLGLLTDDTPLLEAFGADGSKGLSITDSMVQLSGREGRTATLAMLDGESATLRLDALDESLSLSNPGAAASLLIRSGQQRASVTLVADHLSISRQSEQGQRMGTLHSTRVSFYNETADGTGRTTVLR